MGCGEPFVTLGSRLLMLVSFVASLALYQPLLLRSAVLAMVKEEGSFGWIELFAVDLKLTSSLVNSTDGATRAVRTRATSEFSAVTALRALLGLTKLL